MATTFPVSKLKNILAKQSKLTDAYLDDQIGIDIYKSKNFILKQEEEEPFKSILAEEEKEEERWQTKENQIVTQEPTQSCMSGATVSRFYAKKP